ncbi:MAG: aminoacyl-tRNA hydrolase [Actinomycetes bacterium]
MTSGQDGDSPGPWLVVGLGNPGPGYAANRHNVGYLVLDVLAGRVGGRFSAHRGRAQVVEGRLSGRRIVLAKPLSYMNDSGGPVAAVRSFYRAPVGRLIVVHDELDLEYGVLRVKAGGGDNGHNGLRSVRAALGSGEYSRVRVGIGRPPGRMDPATYVLRDFSGEQRRELAVVLDRAADAVESLIAEGLVATQNRFNG